MQGATENKKTKHPGGSHHHPLNMVWKIRRGSRDGTSSSHAAKAYSSESKEYLKGSDGSQSSRCSSAKTFDQQYVRDQSTKSAESSRSAHSKQNSEGSDNHSATSGSSGSSNHASKASGRKDKAQTHPQTEKSVRFNEIHIRDYERIVGDNPSCSSGPPIALGWGHGDTRILDVDSYEDLRTYKKKAVRIVLTRDEREQILLRWGVSFHEIIDSIRTNIKVKNQRRQTVTNLGKVERIEEAFESATRKLKRALQLRRKTGPKLKQLQEQSELASHTLASLKIAEDHALSEIRAVEAPIQHEPEHDNLENLQVQVSVSNFCRQSPAESKIQRSNSNLSDDDGASVISGFTIGNSTTASMLEVERFYRELELEMFGDMELPSMVGQTLEVPGVDIPEETRYYKDPPSVTGYPADDISSPQPKANTVDNPDSKPYHHQIGNAVAPTNCSSVLLGDGHSPMLSARTSLHQPNIIRGDERPSILSRSLRQPQEFRAVQHRHYSPPDFASPGSLHQQYPQSSSWYGCDDNHNANHYPTVKLSSSLDSCEMSSHYARSAVAAVEQQYLTTFAPPPSMLPPPSVHHSPGPQPYSTGRANRIPQSTSPIRNKYSSSSRPGADAPQVRHVPPPTHLTPTHWMDDCDGPTIRRFEDPITISEEPYDQSEMLIGGVRQDDFRSPGGYDPFRKAFPFPSRQAF